MLKRKNKSQAGLWYLCWLCREMNKACIFKKSKLTWSNHRQQNSQLKQFEVLKNYFYLFSALQGEEQDDESLVQWIFESSPGCLLFKHMVKIIPRAMTADDFLAVLTFLNISSVFFLKTALHYIVRNKSNVISDTFWKKRYCLDAGMTMMERATEGWMCQCKMKH